MSHRLKEDDIDDLRNLEEHTHFSKTKGFNFEKFLLTNRLLITLALFGLILIGLGVFLYKDGLIGGQDTIEVLESTEEVKINASEIIVEIAGSVEKPGVYKLKNSSRIDDLLIAGGGLSVDADRVWVEKYVNRAAPLSDGQKMYIKSVSEQSVAVTANNSGGDQTIPAPFSTSTEGLTDINTATLTELDTLPGIGPVYGQSVIDHRPYSTVDELLSKGALKKSVYEKVKDKVSVY